MSPNQIFYVNAINDYQLTLHTTPNGAFIGGSTNVTGDLVQPTAPGNAGQYYRFEKVEPYTFDSSKECVKFDKNRKFKYLGKI